MKKLLIIFTLLFGFSEARAQISFPKSNVIDTVIHVDLAYYETQVIFHTGKYKSSDYLYKKISDSLDPNWFVTACFNGDCRNELEQGGKFLSEFGLNDTTCFIAFHVESHDINGKSRIRYKVINSKDSTDQAILDVTVTYISTTGFEQTAAEGLQVKCYPNPASQFVNIYTGIISDFEVSIYNLQGKILLNQQFSSTNQASINTAQLPKGMYFIQVANGRNSSTRKILID
ncbi:MAG: T9SS type A sorting domain-containing protein [Bacteroidia bacterium]